MNRPPTITLHHSTCGYDALCAAITLWRSEDTKRMTENKIIMRFSVHVCSMTQHGCRF